MFPCSTIQQPVKHFSTKVANWTYVLFFVKVYIEISDFPWGSFQFNMDIFSLLLTTNPGYFSFEGPLKSQ